MKHCVRESSISLAERITGLSRTTLLLIFASSVGVRLDEIEVVADDDVGAVDAVVGSTQRITREDVEHTCSRCGGPCFIRDPEHANCKAYVCTQCVRAEGRG